MGGCNKCTGSCACKAKKPRVKKAPAKRVIGGRVKAPQVVIIGDQKPLQNPYQTVVTTSMPGVNLKPEVKEPQKKTAATQTSVPPVSAATQTSVSPVSAATQTSVSPVSTETQTDTPTRSNIPSLREYLSIPPPSLVKGALKFSMKPAERKTTETQTIPSVTTTETQTIPSVTTTETQTETVVPKRRKPYDAGFMSILPEVIKFEQGKKRGMEIAAAKKPSMTTMETQTEPLELLVSKGQRKNIFEFMKEQELTGKVAALTGAGRPFRANVEEAMSPTPPPPAVMAAGAPAPSSTAAALASFSPSSRQSSLREFFRSAPAPPASQGAEESPE